ncbi:MAG: HU family DNA-binding protein [Rhodocyclaceae bacterium]|nr:HU family DNA-binding protein [Rhodocyclaceae bacterium]
MNKSELIDLVQANVGKHHPSQLSKAQVGAVLESFGEVAAEALGMNGEVPLPGLGKFKAVSRAARNGRNPKTGETIAIPARNSVTFQAAKNLRDTLNR